MLIVLIGAAIALVAVQYRTRSVRASVATGAGRTRCHRPDRVDVAMAGTADAGASLGHERHGVAARERVAGSSVGGMALSRGIGLPMVVGVSGYSGGSGSGFHVTSSTMRFPAGYGADGRIVELSAEWLSQAELVILHTIPAGSVTRTVQVPGFQMIDAPPRSDTPIGARR